MICKKYDNLSHVDKIRYIGELIHIVQNDDEFYEMGVTLINKAKEKEIKNEDHHTEGELGNACIDINALLILFEQAKEMEKGQIIDAYNAGDENGYQMAHSHNDKYCVTAEEYFQELN